MAGVVAATNTVTKAIVTGRYVPSQKGTQLLIDPDNFKYRKHKPNAAGNLVFYKCQKRFDKNVNCQATAVLNPESMEIVRVTNSHNHRS